MDRTNLEPEQNSVNIPPAFAEDLIDSEEEYSMELVESDEYFSENEIFEPKVQKKAPRSFNFDSILWKFKFTFAFKAIYEK